MYSSLCTSINANLTEMFAVNGSVTAYVTANKFTLLFVITLYISDIIKR